MRVTILLSLGAGALLLAAQPMPASADGRNPEGFGIYSPETKKVIHVRELF